MSQTAAPERVNNLDVIRFVAAAAVIYGHAFPLNGASSPGFLSNSVQTIGVKVFFMLSGFLIAQSWHGDPNPFRFVQRRALRLFPGLALVLALSAFVLGPLVTAVPLRDYFANARFWSYLGNIGLNISYDLPGVFLTNPYPIAVNGSLWSLPVEVTMYLLAPPILLIAALSRRPRLVLWVVTLLGALASAVFVRLASQPLSVVFYGIGLGSLLDVAPYFLVGMLCFVHGWHRRLSAQTAALALFVALLFPSGKPVIDELVLMALVPIVVLGLGFATEPRYATAGRFGDVSYGLYLYGFVVQQAVTHAWGHAMAPWLNALISGVISLMLALLSWHVVEKNALKLRPRGKSTASMNLLAPDAAPEPDTRRAHVEAVVLLVALNAVQVLPWLLFRTNRWKYLLPGNLQLTAEVFVCALLVVFAPQRFRRHLAAIAGAALVAVLTFNIYHLGFGFEFQREPALVDDLPLALNGFHYLQELLGPMVWLALATFFAALVVATWLTARALLTVAAAARTPAWRGALSVALIVSIAIAALGSDRFGGARTAPLVQNVRASMARRAQINAALLAAPDTRYRGFASAHLEHKPRVYLVMVEAYGQRLVSDEHMKEPFRELTRRMSERLSKAGFHMRTARSEAPVFGGRSWLSIDTVLTGIRIDQPGMHSLLSPVAQRVPSFYDFFKKQGYVTYSVQPGHRDRPGLTAGDVFRPDFDLDGPALEYRGVPFGWVRIPDQFALGVYRQKLSAEKRPTFAFYMSVSTHHPWLAVPFAEKWQDLQHAIAPTSAPFEPVPGVERLGNGARHDYFESVIYEWRALAEFIESDPDDDAIYLLVGDHQPLLERSTLEAIDDDVAAARSAQSLNTIIHVISRDRTFVDSFTEAEAGLFVEPGAPQFRHEGLFSIFVSRLAARHGGKEAVGALGEYPEGIGLSGLLLQ